MASLTKNSQFDRLILLLQQYNQLQGSFHGDTGGGFFQSTPTLRSRSIMPMPMPIPIPIPKKQQKKKVKNKASESEEEDPTEEWAHHSSHFNPAESPKIEVSRTNKKSCKICQAENTNCCGGTPCDNCSNNNLICLPTINHKVNRTNQENPRKEKKIRRTTRSQKAEKCREERDVDVMLTDSSPGYQSTSSMGDEFSILVTEPPLSPEFTSIPDSAYEYPYSPPHKKRKTRTKEIPIHIPTPIPTEKNQMTATKKKQIPIRDSSLLPSTDTIISRCINRRARPTGRALGEEELSYLQKNSTLTRGERDHNTKETLKEIGMIQRIMMELDLCLRLASNTHPPFFSYPVRAINRNCASQCGDRRPFLSVRGLENFKSHKTIPNLRDGDIIHVPFSPEEQLLVIRCVSVRLETFLQKKRYSPLKSTHDLADFQKDLQDVYEYLPGRSNEDCIRWLQSFINKLFFANNNDYHTPRLKSLYELQEKTHRYKPKALPLMKLHKDKKARTTSLSRLLLLRELNPSLMCHKEQEKMIHSARRRCFQQIFSVSRATSEVIDVKIDPTGKTFLAICSSKVPNELVLHRIGTHQDVALQGHTKTVSRITFAKGGDLLVSASFDKTIRLWDTASSTCLFTFEKRNFTEIDDAGMPHHTALPGHEHDIISMAHGKGDKDNLIVSGDKEKGLFLWDIYANTMLHDLSTPMFTPDWPGPILETEFIGGFYPSYFIAGTENVTPKGPGVVQLWDSLQGKVLRVCKESKGYVSCICPDPQGHLCISGSVDKFVRLYDWRVDHQIASVPTLLEGEQDINAVTFSPCGRYITSSGEDNRTLVFDRRKNFELLHVLPHTRPTPYNRAQGVMSIKWIDDTGMLITGGEDGVNVWDLEIANPLVSSHKSHSAPVSCLDSSKYFFVSGADDTVVAVYSDSQLF